MEPITWKDSLQTSNILGREFLADTHTLADVKRRRAYILKHKTELREDGSEEPITTQTLEDIVKKADEKDTDIKITDTEVPIIVGAKVIQVPGNN